jgi:hypothetical protein
LQGWPTPLSRERSLWKIGCVSTFLLERFGGPRLWNLVEQMDRLYTLGVAQNNHLRA